MTIQHPDKKNKGVALVVTISLMLALSTLAVAFVRLSTYERVAAANHTAYVDAKLTAEAGINRVVAIMLDQALEGGSINWTQKLNAAADFHKSQLLYPPIEVNANLDLKYPDDTDHDGTLADIANASKKQGAARPDIISLYDGELHGGEFSFSGLVGKHRGNDILGRFEPNGNFYALKIVDSSGGLNVNSHIALAPNNDEANVVIRAIIKRLAEECGLAASAQAIIDFLRPGADNFTTPVWTNLADIKTALTAFDNTKVDLLVDNHFSLAADTRKFNVNGYFTVAPFNIQANLECQAVIRKIASSSVVGFTDAKAEQIAAIVRPPAQVIARKKWFDKEELRAAFIQQFPIANAADQTLKDRFLSNLCTDSFINHRTVSVLNPLRGASAPPTYFQEARAPVNINNASRQLLIALIANIRATGTFYQNAITAPTDSSTFPNSGNGSGVSGNFVSETAIVNAAGLFELEFETGSIAANLADAILDRIDGSKGDFQDQGAFNEFMDDALLTGKINTKDVIPTKARTPTATNDDNLANHTTFDPDVGINKALFFRAGVDAIKSNFNPNAIDNFWNMSRPAYQKICKGDLFFSDNQVRHHTTEFTFFNINGLEVTSLARITAENGSSIISEYGITTDVKFGDLIQHTSQLDFFNTARSGSTTPDVISSPSNLLRAGTLPDPLVGAVETKPIIPGTGAGTHAIYKSSELFAGDFTGTSNKKDLPASKTAPPASMITIFPMEATNLRNSSTGNLVHDGIISKTSYGSQRYFVESAFDGRSMDYTIRNTSTQGLPDLRANNTLGGNNNSDFTLSNASNIGNRKGTLEFWVKLDVDKEDSNKTTDNPQQNVPCGIMGITLASGFRSGRPFQIAGFGPNPFDNLMREGIQMYIYRNTVGQLRVTRLYWAITFDDAGAAYGTLLEGDVDFQRKIARRDRGFDVKDWNAHEWHHIRVQWDDTVGVGQQSSLEMFVDGHKLTTGYLDQDNPSFQREWCVANEVEPTDSFFINGFKRQQKQTGGYFEFTTLVNYIGNCTIDQVISYGSVEVAANTPTGTAAPARYPATNTYTNDFIMGSSGYVAGVRWTSYPVFRNSGTAPFVNLTGLTHTAGGSPNTITFTALPAVPNPSFEKATGMSATRVNQGDRINYTFTFTNRNNEATDDATARDAEGYLSPILDSVTLLFFHTFPKVNYKRNF